jgi:hypothetical protein
MTSERARRLSWAGLGVGCALACTPPAAAPHTPAAPPAPEAQLSLPPPSSPEPASVPDDDMTCVTPPDPEFDKESSWSKELGRQLALELPNARRCTRELAPDTRASLTLRLVYAQDGSPLSRHVVASSPEACPLAECVKDELADVNAAKLDIEQGSYDLALILERDRVPERSPEPVDPLGADDAPSSCVDADVQRLSRRAVHDIVSTTHEQLKSCYGQALVRRHDAAGTVTFEFVIGRQGEIASVHARESTLHDCGAVECMLAEFRPLRFPTPVGRSVRVVYPVKYVLEQQPVQLK